jgi:hypothetical protein
LMVYKISERYFNGVHLTHITQQHHKSLMSWCYFQIKCCEANKFAIYRLMSSNVICWSLDIFRIKVMYHMNKGNNKITELRAILQRESQNS